MNDLRNNQLISPRPPKDSQVEMTQLVLPQHTNALDTVFGGTVMSWVDIAAAVVATRHCRRPVVTASIDAMNFLAPIKRGWIVSILASINYASTRSCEIGVKVMSENPLTGEMFHTATAYATFVALGDDGKPMQIPAVNPQTPEEKIRYEAAKIRREARLALRAQITRTRKK